MDASQRTADWGNLHFVYMELLSVLDCLWNLLVKQAIQVHKFVKVIVDTWFMLLIKITSICSVGPGRGSVAAFLRKKLLRDTYRFFTVLIFCYTQFSVLLHIYIHVYYTKKRDILQNNYHSCCTLIFLSVFIHSDNVVFFQYFQISVRIFSEEFSTRFDWYRADVLQRNTAQLNDSHSVTIVIHNVKTYLSDVTEIWKTRVCKLLAAGDVKMLERIFCCRIFSCQSLNSIVRQLDAEGKICRNIK